MISGFKVYSVLLIAFALTFGVTYLTMADGLADPFANPTGTPLNSTRPDAPWIATWLMLDGLVNNTGGFAVSAPIDWLSNGSGGAVTQESVSTLSGLLGAQGVTINLPNNGGALNWAVLTIDVNENNNMSTVYGLADETNVDTYAIIVIDSPSARTTTMAPAHDDHAQIWVNGAKCYNNSAWTGGHHQVDFEFQANLNSGLNVLLYRCGESGGDDHFNLHFAAGGDGLVTLPTANQSTADFFRAVAGGATAVDPKGKVSTTWADIKRQK